MSRAPILAARSLPAGTNGYRVPLIFRVEGGLRYIRGNHAPYFSLTYTQHRKGFPDQCYSGGAGHERIAELFGDRFADLAALHLSDIDGVPMHAETNGWYQMAGALGGAGERYHAGNAETYGRPRDPLADFARHCRISMDEAEAIRYECAGVAEPVAPGRPHNWESARATMAAHLRGMRPRWKAEAEACIARHSLRVHGDPWYRLVDTWNGGTGEPRTVWTGADPDDAMRWVLDHTPYSFHEATTRQGYRLEPIP